MVEYTTWTALAFEVADDSVQASRVVSRAAELWRSHKAGLQEATKAEARDFARRNL